MSDGPALAPAPGSEAAGLLTLTLHGENLVTVNMGAPIFDAARIPFTGGRSEVIEQLAEVVHEVGLAGNTGIFVAGTDSPANPLALFDDERARAVYPMAFEQGAAYGESLLRSWTASRVDTDPAA